MSGTSGLHLRRNDSAASIIDAVAARHGGRVGREVLGDLNRQGRRAWAPGRAVDRAWTYDAADRRDPRWWPQGVDTSGSVAAVTWYAKQLPGDAANHGSRITLFDLDTCRYRHVLLVQPTLADGVPGVAPLRVHAGGLAWAGDHLHVAATAKGFWTAHLDDVLRVPEGPATAGVRRDALGYRYVLPVRESYRAGADEGMDRLRYSFFSRSVDALVVGEYATGSATRRLARIPLDPTSGLPVVDATGTVVPEVLGEGVGNMQGAVLGRDGDGGERWYATTSHGRARLGSIWTGTPGSLTRHRWALPMGPEDLSLDPATDTLWSVTEHPFARWICAMKRSTFD